jgi:TonB family protein
MLHPFVSLPYASRNFAPVLALSASVHVGLVYAAVASTGVVRRPHVPEAVVELVRFAELPVRRALSRARPPTARVERRDAIDAEPALGLPGLPPSYDLMLPEPAAMPDYLPDYSTVEIGGDGILTDDVLHLGLGRRGARMSAAALYGAYEDVAVDKLALPAPDNEKPRYPRRLIGHGVEARFNVTFVVDTSGRVDRESVELPPSVQPEFRNAVADVLFEWRFAPAELSGRRVRQRVLQPFIFRVERRFGVFGGG